MPGAFIGTNSFENLQATDLREIQIKQNDSWGFIYFSFEIGAPREQMVERLNTVTGAMDRIGNLRPSKCHVRQLCIVVVVLD